ncbi:MAG TPA: 6-bladed beta-propeller, partial [Chloroflexia bacterium]
MQCSLFVPLRRILTLLAILGLMLVFALPSRPNTILAQTDRKCFSQTGFCISGRLLAFWEQNGGLPIFGFPITPQHEEMVGGKPFQVQWFERNRLELHPENAPPYDVLPGRSGVDSLDQQGRNQSQFPKSTPQEGCRFFPATSHNVCGAIWAVWQANGLEFDGRRGKSEAENIALFGLPLSEAQTETIEGKTYTVQWFERARLELHPEYARPHDVLLGLLGNEIRAGVVRVLEPRFLFKFGSSSTGDGPGDFRNPQGIAVNSSKNIIVLDNGNQRIQSFNSTGKFLFQFGSLGSGDGEFNNPVDSAVDNHDRIIVLDNGNHRVQVFDPGGKFLFKFGSLGSGDGEFSFPAALATDSSGNIIVLDAGNNLVQVFDSNGKFLFKFGSFGAGDGEF